MVHLPLSSSKTKGFLALLGVTLLTFSTMYSPQPLLSSIQAYFPGYSGASIALLMTLILVPLGVAPLIYGAFLSSLDTRLVLQTCVGILALGSLGIYFTDSFVFLLFFRLLQGLAIPAVLTCIMAHISAKFQGAHLQRALAIYIAVTILSGLLGRICSGAIATLLDWRHVFLFLGLGLVGILWPLRFLESQAEHHCHRVKLAEFRAIFKTPGIINLLFIDACGFFVFAGLSNYLPFHLNSMGEGVSEWRISLMYLGFGVGVFMALASRRISQWLGSEVKAIRLGICIYLCIMPLFLLPTLWGIFAAMFIVCIGQFLEHSISPGLINRMADKDKGAVNGIYLSVYYMGGALGSYLPGLLYGLWGWDAMIFGLSFFLLAALGATLGLERHTPRFEN